MKKILQTLPFVFCLMLTSVHAADVTKSDFRNFSKDVIFGMDRADGALRFAGIPALKVQTDNPLLKKFTETRFQELVKATGMDKPGNATVEVYIGEYRDLNKIYERELDLPKNLQPWKWWVWWNGKMELTRAVIFVSTDKLDEKRIEDKISDLLYGSFGLAGHSDEVGDKSCLSDEDPIGEVYTKFDLEFLHFYYQEVPIGAKRSEVNKIASAYWEKTDK